MYQELTSLRQTKKEVKRLLFEKSQEALQLEAKILHLRNKVVDLEEKVEGMQTQMAKLEERPPNTKSSWGRWKGSWLRRSSSSRRPKRNSTMTSLMLMTRGSKMPWLSLPACILRWIFPLSMSPSVSFVGNSCLESNHLVT